MILLKRGEWKEIKDKNIQRKSNFPFEAVNLKRRENSSINKGMLFESSLVKNKEKEKDFHLLVAIAGRFVKKLIFFFFFCFRFKNCPPFIFFVETKEKKVPPSFQLFRLVTHSTSFQK